MNKAYEILINTIEVKNNLVTYSNDSEVKIYKPVFRTKNDKVIISKLALDTKQMMVELYFGNELIHSETIKGEGVLNRVYKLDKTLKGDYTALIRTNGRVYVENFKI